MLCVGTFLIALPLLAHYPSVGVIRHRHAVGDTTKVDFIAVMQHGLLFNAMAVDIVELEFDVRVPVPIQADRVFAVTAALHKVIIQVEVAVTIEEFPGAPTAVPAGKPTQSSPHS